MEAWLGQHWFSILSAVAYVVAIAIHYGKTRAHIDMIEASVNEVKADVAKMKDGGMPILCRLHEERLTRLESLISQTFATIQSDVAELKQIGKDNRELINRKLGQVD